MPELPEVEGFRLVIDRHMGGRRIRRVRALDAWMLRDTTPAKFERALTGRTVTRTHRRGKLLLAFTDDKAANGPVLGLHFGMTGHPHPAAPGEPAHRWDRLVFEFDDSTQLRYRNQRRLGYIRLSPRALVTDLLWGLGPEPLEAPAAWFAETLSRRRGPVKGVLLDQGFLAGIGNIYADEALFEAGIRPDRPANTLSAAESRNLHRAIRSTLRRGIRAAEAGRRPRLALADVRTRAARQRTGPGLTAVPCPSCGRPLNAATLGGRTSYFCARCQS
ncbi:MAG TPA: DNA-formamidopyrimidine glycosylase family protein [Actinomycetota bacterium]|nr:DNA-formamidopyrimidine glycosylase family protein [Actinomycetota bacterium]